MSTKLYLSIDLGGDTIKICFGFMKNGKEYIGKFVNSESILPDPIPAAAYYDEDKRQWYYGEDIESMSNGSFLTVVKIKKLLSLLRRMENNQLFEINKEFYFSKNQFPKFYFPEKISMLENFGEMVESDMTFTAPGFTPQIVCENFFKYIANLVSREVNSIRDLYGVEFNSISLTAVTPTYYGKVFCDELNRLISTSFNHEIDLSIDATKAMCFSAYQQNLFDVDDKVLVFDMGEESISVVRAMLVKGKDGTYVGVDAEDAHLQPIEVGGSTLDEHIIDYLNGELNDRLSLGENKQDIEEIALDSKQYLLLKNVKQAKMLLSDEQYKDDDFSVPLSIWKEVKIQKEISKTELKYITGVTKFIDKSIAHRICDYIIKELNLTINYDVNKILLSGGLVESLGLFEYIVQKIEKYLKLNMPHLNVKVLKIEHNGLLNNEFDVLPYEDSVYCAALGGIKATIGNCKLKTILPYTYGTWGNKNGNRILEIYEGAVKGTILENDHNEFKKVFALGSMGHYTYEIQEEVYSIILSPSEIQERKFYGRVNYYISHNFRNYLVIGKIGSNDHQKAVSTVNLTLVAGGEEGKIIFLVDGKRVSILDKISAETVLHIDSKGHCIPNIRNNDTDRMIKYIIGPNVSGYTFDQNSKNASNSGVRTIAANKVVIRYAGVKGFYSNKD